MSDNFNKNASDNTSPPSGQNVDRPSAKRKPSLLIDCLREHDLRGVAIVDSRSFEFPLGSAALAQSFDSRRAFGFIARQRKLKSVRDDISGQGAVQFPSYRTVGFALGLRHPDRLEIIRLAVLPGLRRHGIGRRLVRRVLDESKNGPGLVTVEVPEVELQVQQFWRAVRFWAVAILAGHAQGENNYLFQRITKPLPRQAHREGRV